VFVFFSFFSQGGQLVVLMPVLAACHLIYVFLPRCMECRRGLAMRILSLCLSVCHTRELWQNGRKICPDLYTI